MTLASVSLSRQAILKSHPSATIILSEVHLFWVLQNIYRCTMHHVFTIGIKDEYKEYVEKSSSQYDLFKYTYFLDMGFWDVCVHVTCILIDTNFLCNQFVDIPKLYIFLILYSPNNMDSYSFCISTPITKLKTSLCNLQTLTIHIPIPRLK